MQVVWIDVKNDELTLAFARELSILACPRFELPRHLVSRRFVNDVPPSKSGQESTADVLDQPEVGRKQNRDRDERHDVT